MIIFGSAELLTSIRHGFLGIIHVSNVPAFTYAGGGIGLLYAVSGALVLAQRRWAASVAFAFLAIVVLGRIALVASGLYPIDTFLQLIAIVIGTTIAAAFAIYIGFILNRFR
jgi:hypothetical protein